MTNFYGWLLGLENVTAIDELDPSLAAPWAQEGPFWVFLGAVGLIALAVGWGLLFLDAWRISRPTELALRHRLGFAMLNLVLVFTVVLGLTTA